ncbi:hypothetical protein ACFL6S_13270 [Candidatus Poribacteria bacterium]
MISTRRSLEDLQQQLQQLDSALKTSFANLRRDFLEQERTIEELKIKIAKQEEISEHLTTQIAELKREPSKSKSPVRKTSTQSSLALTPLHLQILKHLMILQLESGRRNVSMRELASELYPNKAYSSIKTTVSKYIKELSREGFIEKINKARLFVSYTEKALRYADDTRLNRMRDLISKPMDR